MDLSEKVKFCQFFLDSLISNSPNMTEERKEKINGIKYSINFCSEEEVDQIIEGWKVAVFDELKTREAELLENSK